MSELEKQKAEEFEQVFRFLPEADPTTDPEGWAICTKVLAHLRECLVRQKDQFAQHLNEADLGRSPTLKTLTELRAIVKITEVELSRAEFLARETGYLGDGVAPNQQEGEFAVAGLRTKNFHTE